MPGVVLTSTYYLDENSQKWGCPGNYANRGATTITLEGIAQECDRRAGVETWIGEVSENVSLPDM